MTDSSSREAERQARERREQDRRGGDRRRPERRAPPPLWRRPWAFIAYGVVGAFLIVALTRLIDPDEPELEPGDITTAAIPPAVDTTAPPAATAPPREGMGAGGYERLLAEGEAAVGQRVVTLLYCETVTSIAMVSNTVVNESVAAVADANGRVPGAECRWGEGSDAPEVLVLVPPELAPRLAAAPEIEQRFVRRRRILAEVEWIGPSEALALRNVAVLRAIQG